MAEFDINLASDLFDAAIDEERWTSLIDRLVDCCGAHSGAVVSVNNAEEQGFQAVWMSRRVTPEIIDAYNNKLSKYEASGVPVIANSPRFQVLTEHDLWPDEQDLQSRPDFVALREMLGIDHRIVARINEDPSWFNTFTIQYRAGREQANKSEQDVFKQYLPFVAQTVRLANIFVALRSRYQAVLSALDKLVLPVALVDSDAHILVSNKSANAVFSQSNGVSKEKDGRLRLSDPDAQSRLRLAISAAAATASAGGTQTVDLFNASRRSGDDPFCIEVSPLRDTDNEIGARFRGALVKIYDPAYHPIIRIDAFARVYGLTSDEMSVAMMLVNGIESEEIAETRNIVVESARDQIRSVFTKTGSTTRTDLVRRALTAHIPIVDPSSP